MKPISLIATLLALAACGADGPPLRPGTTTPGIVFSGEARIGMSN